MLYSRKLLETSSSNSEAGQHGTAHAVSALASSRGLFCGEMIPEKLSLGDATKELYADVRSSS